MYNLISNRTGVNLEVIQDQQLASAPDRPAIAEPVENDDDLSFDELYTEAKRKGIAGRSSMSKSELQAALKPKRRRATTRTRRT
ncbi:MAG: hypothetical protein FJW86_07420 [Actinobacteria bacterium]|nr:hypothetical protein [Actinomycetota bacterium]